jgi:hypothetical protein
MNKTEYVRQTVDLVKQIETRFLELGARLYKIREEKMWSDSYESYQEFLDAAHINPGHASILVSIHKNYVIDGGKKQETLAGIGYSNLYEAIPLIEKNGVDEAVIIASTLTRSEIKDEVRDEKHGVHTHTVGSERWGMCACGKFVKI